METPIACTLTAAEYRDRTAGLGDLAIDHLLSREPIEAGARLTFAYTTDVEQALQAAVAAEAECCPFLTFGLQRSDDRLILDMTGPELARPIIADLFAVTEPAA